MKNCRRSVREERLGRCVSDVLGYGLCVRTRVFVESEKLSEEVLRAESELLEVESLTDSRGAGFCFVASDDDDRNWGGGLCGLGLVDKGLDELKVLGRGSIGGEGVLPCLRRVCMLVVEGGDGGDVELAEGGVYGGHSG